MERDESQLICKARRGDVAAFDSIVRAYQQLAFRTAWVIVRNEQDAQDATQSAFVKAWQAMPHFDEQLPLRPWLLRIVANEAKNRRNARYRDTGVSDIVHQNEPSTGDLPADFAVQQDTSRNLIHAIHTLSQIDQQVILMRYALQLTESEMAQALDIPAGTVKSRLSRALARLRTYLEAQHEQS